MSSFYRPIKYATFCSSFLFSGYFLSKFYFSKQPRNFQFYTDLLFKSCDLGTIGIIGGYAYALLYSESPIFYIRNIIKGISQKD